VTPQEQFISAVLSNILPGPQRVQIEMDLRAHIIERVEHGQSVEEAIRQFGDPLELAESYLASVPLVSADFVERVVAKLVDLILAAGSSCLLLYLAWLALGPDGTPFLSGAATVWRSATFTLCIIVVVFLWPAYFVLAEQYTGETLGKHLLGIRVVRESGARISLGQSLVRQIPLAASIIFVDALFALFTEKNQRAFELISKTRVVEAGSAR
jgi:uncharacterized RDD family membrane protein YckC